ncbi:hypothetical protein JXC34_01295 [Candidatus Woesearchaeota archaeon]|nr:hypothetical protein [Candidatus Woesearchaeota archaeon]
MQKKVSRVPELPKLDDLEFSRQSNNTINSSLSRAEDILKELQSNIQDYKILEKDNLKLKSSLQRSRKLQKEFEERMLALAYTFSEKHKESEDKYKKLLKKYIGLNVVLNKNLSKEKKKATSLAEDCQKLMAFSKKVYDDKKRVEELNKSILEKLSEWKIKTVEEQIRKRNLALKQEIEDRFRNISEKIKEKEKLYDSRQKSILKQHEEMKLDLNKKVLEEKERADLMAHRYDELSEVSKRVLEEKNRLEKMNRSIVKKIALAEKGSIANKEELDRRTEMIKREFEEKLKEIAKQQIEQEIEYRAKIESLTKDLKKYYEELKEYKGKYFEREKEIKEKFEELLR